MDKQQKLIGAAVAAVIIIIGAVVLLGGSKTNNSSMNGMQMSQKQSSATNSNSSTSNADASTAVAATMVDIKDYAFSPAVIKVKVGDTVTWTNQDTVHHNVVADTPSSDAPNGPLIGKGETYSFKFTKAGTYTYHCQPHTYMHGTVVVE